MFTSTQPKIICRSAVTLLLLLALSLTTLSAQFQILSNPIEFVPTEGVSEFRCSALSGDGNTLILSGAVRSDIRINNYRWVQVYQRSGNAWAPKGERFIEGEGNVGSIGKTVAISDDGNTVAFGTPTGSFVYTFSWDGTAWIQKGAEALQVINSSVQMNLGLSTDGNIMVISTASAALRPVRVYEFVDGEWEPMGETLVSRGVGSRQVDCAISGNGKTVIVGNLSETPDNYGAKVLQWINDRWIQKGQALPADAEFHNYGSSVAISEDGNTIAVSTNASISRGQCFSDYLRVFTLQNGSWVQQGSSISSPACLIPYFGGNIALSGDGSVLAVSSYGVNSSGYIDNGTVSTYRYRDGDWRDEVIHQGDESNDEFGTSMSLSRNGKVLAITSNIGGSESSGQVEFFRVGYRPDNDEVCEAVELPVNGIPQVGFNNFYAELNPQESMIQPDANGLGNSLWFTFLAPATGTVTATTCGATDFDTELAIYGVANCDDYSGYVLLGYNNDGEEFCPIRTQSYLTVSDLTPGELYFLVVDGYSEPNVDDTTGNFEITLEESLPTCDNPAIAFDGVDDYVDIGPNQGNFGAGDFTFEMMVKTSQTIDDPSRSHVPLVSKLEGCGCDKSFWYLSLLADGKVSMELSSENCGQGFAFLSENIINDDNWHHIAFAREGDSYSLYVDGTREESHEIPGIDLLNNAASLQLGYSDCIGAGIADLFKGEMDEVRAWNYARSAEEINSFRKKELAGNEEGLTAYYNFNDGKPGDDNTERIGSIDLAGSESVARMIAFDRNGTNSNWVVGRTAILQLDRDEDGLYDACNEPEDLPTATRFAEIPGVHLGQNYPNPTAREVSIPIKLGGQHDAAELRFTSVTGKTIKVHPVPRGTDHDERVQVSDFPPGIYFYSLFVDNRLAGTKRMVIAR